MSQDGEERRQLCTSFLMRITSFSRFVEHLKSCSGTPEHIVRRIAVGHYHEDFEVLMLGILFPSFFRSPECPVASSPFPFPSVTSFPSSFPAVYLPVNILRLGTQSHKRLPESTLTHLAQARTLQAISIELKQERQRCVWLIEGIDPGHACHRDRCMQA